VAIIDTGIANQAVDRADSLLHGVPRTARNIDPLTSFPIGGPHQYLDFDAGHGTFVAGIVNQVAPHAPITMYRAIDSDGVGTEVDVACAMIEAVKDGNQIINLSLGCRTQDDSTPIALEAALAVIAELDAGKPDGDKTIIVAVLPSGLPRGHLGGGAEPEYDSVTVVHPRLLGDLLNRWAGDSLHIRLRHGEPAVRPGRDRVPSAGSLCRVERHLVRRPADRGRHRPAVPGSGGHAPRGAARTTAGSCADTRLRAGGTDTQRHIKCLDFTNSVSNPSQRDPLG
jgi:hypothetical protein